MLADMERGLLGRRPLLMTREAPVIDAVRRLAAAAGVDLEVDAEGRGAWSSAPLVLVGADAAPALASMRLPRRPGVIVVGVGALAATPGAGPAAPEGLWRDALALGAEHVVVLPEAHAWLIQRLSEAADGPSRSGRLVPIVSASGGCGVSTLAVALAVSAQRDDARTILIDGAPDGGGLDLCFGAEALPGIRWPDLADARGRLSASALDQALPHPSGVALLSHARPSSAPDPQVTAAALDAARRGYDLVVVDLAAAGTDDGRSLLEQADATVVVIPSTVRGIAAGLHLLDSVSRACADVQVVLRAFGRGVGPRDARMALGRPDLLELPDHPGLVARADQGDAAVPSDAYGKAVRRILARLLPDGRALHRGLSA